MTDKSGAADSGGGGGSGVKNMPREEKILAEIEESTRRLSHLFKNATPQEERVISRSNFYTVPAAVASAGILKLLDMRGLVKAKGFSYPTVVFFGVVAGKVWGIKRSFKELQKLEFSPIAAELKHRKRLRDGTFDSANTYGDSLVAAYDPASQEPSDLSSSSSTPSTQHRTRRRRRHSTDMQQQQEAAFNASSSVGAYNRSSRPPRTEDSPTVAASHDSSMSNTNLLKENKPPQNIKPNVRTNQYGDEILEK